VLQLNIFVDELKLQQANRRHVANLNCVSGGGAVKWHDLPDISGHWALGMVMASCPTLDTLFTPSAQSQKRQKAVAAQWIKFIKFW